jgi:hypothetical protein
MEDIVKCKLTQTFNADVRFRNTRKSNKNFDLCGFVKIFVCVSNEEQYKQPWRDWIGTTG